MTVILHMLEAFIAGYRGFMKGAAPWPALPSSPRMRTDPSSTKKVQPKDGAFVYGGPLNRPLVPYEPTHRASRTHDDAAKRLGCFRICMGRDGFRQRKRLIDDGPDAAIGGRLQKSVYR